MLVLKYFAPRSSSGKKRNIKSLFLHIFQDSQLVSKKGVIRNVVGGTSTVYLYDEKRDVSIPSKHLVPVKPSKQDKVCRLDCWRV